jgi:hypothetical protein
VKNRPTTDGEHGSLTTTPHAASMFRMFGGQSYGGVTLSRDEMRAVNRLYGYKKEQPAAKPPPPVAPVRADFAKPYEFNDVLREHERALKAHERWEDPSQFLQAGADRGAFKHAEADGLRLAGWLAKHLQPGEDPLRALVRLAVDAGWDVDPEDVGWANAEDGDDSEDEEDKS